MNSDSLASTIRALLLTLLSSTAASQYVSGDQAVAIASGAAALVTLGWSIYSHWKMRKVPETAIVTATAPTVAIAKAESTVGK